MFRSFAPPSQALRHAVSAGACCFTALCAATGTAQTSRPANLETPPAAPVFEWEAPQQCPTRASVLGWVERHLGRPLATVPTQVERVEARVRRESMGYQLEIRTFTGDARRSREMEHADCESLAKAASVIIAIALDPTSIERVELDGDSEAPPAEEAPGNDAPPTPETQTDESAVPQPAPRPAMVDTRPSPTAPASESSGPLTLQLGAALAGQAGPLPRAGLGASLGVVLRGSRLWGEVYGSYWADQRYAFADLNDAEANLGLWGGGLQAGIQVGRGPLQWGVVGVGLEMGMLQATATGLDATRSSRSMWIAATVNSRVTLRLGSGLEAVVQVGALTPLRRARYVIEDYGPIHVASRLGGRAQVGVGWAFSP